MEVVLALCRWDDFAGIYCMRAISEWREFYIKLEAFCNSVDLLRCYLRGGVAKRTRECLQLIALNGQIRHQSSSFVLQAVMYSEWCDPYSVSIMF